MPYNTSLDHANVRREVFDKDMPEAERRKKSAV
jgi:hypothetical protein